ncbi:hypothetical protein O6H91_02G059000 [Diphasiastrum complanatum]|nr:hypothetical protein O6H91_02G059000 [Diphasiastrum complanatum]
MAFEARSLVAKMTAALLLVAVFCQMVMAEDPAPSPAPALVPGASPGSVVPSVLVGAAGSFLVLVLSFLF